MAIFSLIPYSFKVRFKGPTTEYFKLDDILNEGNDIFLLLNEYLEKHLVDYDTFHENRIYESFKNIKLQSDNRLMSGLFTAGKHGHGFDVGNIQTNTIEFQAKPSNPKLIPLYYLMYIPKELDTGIIVFQGFENYNVKNLFLKSFTKYLREALGNNDLTIDLKFLANKQLIKEYLQSEHILKIRLIKNRWSRDIADSLGTPENIPFEGSCEYTICPPKRNFFDHLNSPIFHGNLERFISSDNMSVRDVIQIDSFTYDNIKILSKPTGKTAKTIDLSDSENVRFSEDISDIQTNILDGHPDFVAIDSRAKVFLKEIGEPFLGDTINV